MELFSPEEVGDTQEPPTAPSWSGRQLLWLESFRDIGPARAITIAQAVPDPQRFEAEWPAVREQLGARYSSVTATPVIEFPHFEHLQVVGRFDSTYPPGLTEIPNPPSVLWVRGDLMPEIINVAIVGTRNPNDFGEKTATVAATETVGLGLGVVSGLALGVDAIAHHAAIDSGGYTVAVLAGSLDRPQPRRNGDLADRILKEGGALVCEVLPDATPSPGFLVGRNRIQSGLSVATVIAQSGIPGGTLHTARFTIEQERQLIVPQPSEDRGTDPSLAGNIALADPSGIDPALISAKGNLARLVRDRRPVADATPTTPSELRECLAAF